MQKNNQSSICSQEIRISESALAEGKMKDAKIKEILNILTPVSFDESLAHYEVHSH